MRSFFISLTFLIIILSCSNEKEPGPTIPDLKLDSVIGLDAQGRKILDIEFEQTKTGPRIYRLSHNYYGSWGWFYRLDYDYHYLSDEATTSHWISAETHRGGKVNNYMIKSNFSVYRNVPSEVDFDGWGSYFSTPGYTKFKYSYRENAEIKMRKHLLDLEFGKGRIQVGESEFITDFGQLKKRIEYWDDQRYTLYRFNLKPFGEYDPKQISRMEFVNDDSPNPLNGLVFFTHNWESNEFSEYMANTSYSRNNFLAIQEFDDNENETTAQSFSIEYDELGRPLEITGDSSSLNFYYNFRVD